MCHCLRISLEDFFTDIFFVACVLSKTSIAWTCSAVARRSLTPGTSAYSSYSFGIKIRPLSYINNVGRYVSLVIISLETFAVLTAVGLDVGFPNAYLENTSLVLMIIWQRAFGGSSGNKYICMTSFGPKFHSNLLMSSGVVCELSISTSWMQVWHSFNQLPTWFANDGNIIFVRFLASL